MASRTGFTPIAKDNQSLADRVTEAVRRSIIDGRLSAGETVSISALAADLDVSSGPVREALQRLSTQGLVELRPARTAIVAPLTLDDIAEIYRLCRLVEVDAAARACPDLESGDLEELERRLAVMAQSELDSGEFWRAHDSFHLGLMRPVLSARLERILGELWESRERYVRLDLKDGPSDLLLAAERRHRELFDVARSGDSEAMRRALTEHLAFNERSLSSSLSRTLVGG